VPEGLLPTITISLAMAVQRLAQRGVLVKKLAVVETLGTVSVICADKSGTLTQNQMTVREAWVGGKRLSVSGVGYEPAGAFSPTPAGSVADDLALLLTAATLCNNSRLNPPSPERPTTCLGDQTEPRCTSRREGWIEDRIVNRTFHDSRIPSTRRKRIYHPPQRTHMTLSSAAPQKAQLAATFALWRGSPDDATRAEIMAANDDVAQCIASAVAGPAGSSARASAAGYTPRTSSGPYLLGLLAMTRLSGGGCRYDLSRAGIRMVMVTGDYDSPPNRRRRGMLSSHIPHSHGRRIGNHV
jgi:magnesium-transporting ATPase (P-type)